MNKPTLHCEYNNPDCENCPYPDCIANDDDIARQNVYRNRLEMMERNKKIVSMIDRGFKPDDIGRIYGIRTKTVSAIVRMERMAHG